jgi:hypothetical protein
METNKPIVSVPEGQTIIETKILSFGELLVGIELSEPNEDNVAKVKSMMAEIANLMKDDYNTEQKSPVKSLLFDHAVGELVNAQMAVVKVITFKS